MRGSTSFHRTRTAEDGDLALALTLDEAERGLDAVPRAVHTDDWATLQSDVHLRKILAVLVHLSSTMLDRRLAYLC